MIRGNDPRALPRIAEGRKLHLDCGSRGRMTRRGKPAPRRTGRITVYAEVTEEDRRDLTITAAMLGVEKGDIVRALLRDACSDSPSQRQLDRLRELVEKHG
jgi:hypothetical protein